jgi:predicted ATPase
VAFPDGVRLVELAALTDPGLLVHTVFQGLDMLDQTSSWPMATLTSFLADKRLLLVLDNCEHLVGAWAVLVDGLLQACANLRILTTSRQPLGIAGETTFRVPSLSVPNRTCCPRPRAGEPTKPWRSSKTAPPPSIRPSSVLNRTLPRSSTCVGHRTAFRWPSS